VLRSRTMGNRRIYALLANAGYAYTMPNRVKHPATGRRRDKKGHIGKGAASSRAVNVSLKCHSEGLQSREPALSNAEGDLLLHVWGGHFCPPALEVGAERSRKLLFLWRGRPRPRNVAPAC